MAERRLTAILCADVVGYSRLMHADEEGTYARLKALKRGVIDPTVALHSGRIVKTTGDGFLAEFRSAVEGVRAAIEIQAAIGAGDDAMSVRTGVHLGDVIHEKGDVFGDGVNIAARLEQLAEPGTVCISRQVFDEVRDKVSLIAESLGEQQVKNIARPIEVYRVRAATDYVAAKQNPSMRRRRWPVAIGAAALAMVVAGAAAFVVLDRASPPSGALPASAPHLSIAVLPLTNLSGNPTDDAFVDGITEDLITDLSRISGAFVTSRNTSFALKVGGGAPAARTVGRELGVRHVLEGSVRRSADHVRVNVQLVDTETGAQVWADRFDVAARDAYALQDTITGRLARALHVELKESVSRRVARGRPDDLDAALLATRAWVILFNKPQSRDTNEEVRPLLERALALDPKNAEAWTGLAYMHTRAALYRWSASPAESVRLAIEAGNKAVTLDPRSADAHYVLGFAVRIGGETDRAKHLFKTCLELNPNYAPAWFWLGWFEIYDGRPELTGGLVDKAFRLSPRDGLAAVWHNAKAYAYVMLGDDKAAVASAQEGIALNPRHPNNWFVLASALAHLGRQEDAAKALATYTSINVNSRTIETWRATGSQSSNPRFVELRRRIVDGLR
jgi:TolB-like protein/class 3 adenylate cyclase/Tfp pilus assembly protein PilF